MYSMYYPSMHVPNLCIIAIYTIIHVPMHAVLLSICVHYFCLQMYQYVCFIVVFDDDYLIIDYDNDAVDNVVTTDIVIFMIFLVLWVFVVAVKT